MLPFPDAGWHYLPCLPLIRSFFLVFIATFSAVGSFLIAKTVDFIAFLFFLLPSSFFLLPSSFFCFFSFRYSESPNS
jgi:hypothetical protein